MRRNLRLVAGAAVVALLQSAGAAESAANSMACGKTIAWDATEESLKKQFGAANVVYKDLGGPEGSEMMGTAVNEKVPGKTFSVVWTDDAKRANPSMIIIDPVWKDDDSKPTYQDWVSPDGLKGGMSIVEVEKINGKPFKLSGFGWDYGGTVLSWEGGKLDTPTDPKCFSTVNFGPSAENAPESTMGDKEIMSNDKDVVASKPEVGRVTVTFMRDEPAPK